MRLRIYRLRQRWVDGFYLCFPELVFEEFPKALPIDFIKTIGTVHLPMSQKKLGCIRSGGPAVFASATTTMMALMTFFHKIWAEWPLPQQWRRNVSDVTKEAGLVSEGIGMDAGCTFLDYDRDGYLDLFVSNYVGFI